MRAFNLDLPLWKQYWYFWVSLFHGDLGTSILQFPTPVTSIIMHAVPYTLGLLIPAIAAQLVRGQQVRRARRAPQGARQHAAAARLRADRDAVHVARDPALLGASPSTWHVFPVGFALRPDGEPRLGRGPSSRTSRYHWFLPFLSLFLVAFGGWAIGMRNMIIYELESDYAHYLEALGAPQRLVRKYAFRNAMLPQITGPRARARRGHRRRARDRDRLLVSRASATRSTARSRTRTTS